MQYLNPFPDLRISRVIFGSWAIGGWYYGRQDKKQSLDAIAAAYDCGIQTFDTAPVYGQSEELLGMALKNKECIILTKCGLVKEGGQFFFHYDESTDIYKNLTKASIIKECESSLRLLQRDCIDIYQIHFPDLGFPHEETLEAFYILWKAGKIRYAGISNATVEQFHQFRLRSEVPVISCQERYSLLYRKSEKSHLPYTKKNKLLYFAYSPLASGLLNGKKRNFEMDDWRGRQAMFTEEYVKLIQEKIELYKKEYGSKRIFQTSEISFEDNFSKYDYHQNDFFSMAALAWVLQREGISAAIAGIRKKEHAFQNAMAASLLLSSGEALFLTETFSTIPYRGK